MKLSSLKDSLKYWEFFTVVALWVGGYFLYGTSLPFDSDSINYALGIIEHFNVSENMPHPPGYFFHILFGKFLHLFLENPFRIQQIENIYYLTILLLILFLIPSSKEMRLFFCSFPIFLFLVGAPVHYAALAGFSALNLYLVLKTIEKKCSPLLLITIFAIAIGFRQDLSIFLLPSVLYALYIRRPSIKEFSLMFAIFICITMIWFIPTSITTRKEGNLIEATIKFFLIFSKGSSFLFGASLKESIRCGIRFILFSIATLGPGGLVYIFLSLKKAKKNSILLLLLGIAPPILFGIFIHGPKPGYYGTAIGFFLVWSLKFAQPFLKPSLLLLLICVNILFFVTVPPQYNNLELIREEKANYQYEKNYLKKISNLIRASICRNGMRELLYYRDLHKKADSLYKNCKCVSSEVLDLRVLYYFTSYRWHNQIDTSSAAECCGKR